MRRISVMLLFVLLFSFTIALDEPAILGGEAEQLQEGIDKSLPFDDSGNIDFDNYKPYQSKAEERIVAINKYVGPITNTLFGVELTLSWIFVFALVMWILLIELIIVPVSSIFDWNIWASLVGAGIIASLAMQGFGKDFIIWIESLMIQWWIGFVVLIGAGLFAVIYSAVMHALAAKLKDAKEKEAKAKTKRDREVINAEAEIAKKELESN